MTWFNIVNNQNNVLDIDITELSWDSKKINPSTNQPYGTYGPQYKYDTGAATNPGPRYYYYTSLRFNTKKVICGDDFITLDSVKDNLINGNDLNIDNYFILIEGDYTFKKYDTNTSDFMESIAAQNLNSKFTALQYPMTWGGNSEAVKVPFYFTLRLMNETNINNITNSYIYDSSMATVWGTPGIRNDTNKYWKGGNIGYAIPLSNKGNTINHSFYSVDINGISYSGFKTAPQSQYLADVYNSYINKRKIAAFNSIPQRPICLPMFNSRLRYWNTPINYTQTLQNPHTHYFSLLYNYFLGFFGNTISSFPYFSFNINCSKRTGPDTGTDGRPGTVDQTLQIGNQPETLPGFFDNDLIETTYLKITRIKKRV